jgi:CRISPR system Cascade subunit CasC
MLIEAHVIHTVPVSRMNSGEDGTPKSIFFGNANRDRLSSQAQKAAARAYTKHFELYPAEQRARRTRLFTQLVEQELLKSGIEPELAATLSTRAMAALGMGHKAKGEKQLDEILIFFSDHELAGFVEAIIAHQSEIASLDFAQLQADEDATESVEENTTPIIKKPKTSKAQTKDKAKKLFPVKIRAALQAPFISKHSFEVAIYGRQLTNFPDGTVDGQIQVAHAFSVHRTTRQLDFFTSRDDCAEPGMPLAGMMGSQMITAPVYYRAAAVNLTGLTRALGSDKRAKEAASAVLEAFILALPSGSKNSHFSVTLPSFVLLQCVERGTALSLAPAFEKAITPDVGFSMSELAMLRLDEYIQDCEVLFPQAKRQHKVYLTQHNQIFHSAEKLESLPNAITAVLDPMERA